MLKIDLTFSVLRGHPKELKLSFAYIRFRIRVQESGFHDFTYSIK